MNGVDRCDVCGVPVVQRGDRWVHADPLRAAFSPAGDHDPVKVDQAAADYIRTEQFDLPDGYAAEKEASLRWMFGNGETAGARIVIDDVRADYPAYAEYLADLFAKELGR